VVLQILADERNLNSMGLMDFVERLRSSEALSRLPGAANKRSPSLQNLKSRFSHRSRPVALQWICDRHLSLLATEGVEQWMN
jgi:hypothetical protein